MNRRVFVLSAFALGGCHHDLSPQDVNIRGLVPDLAFSMTDTQTGKPVDASDFLGKVTLLYFGYTNCPDVCPATLYNLTRIFQKMGSLGNNVQVLFVTVDPDRDEPGVLNQYTALFGNNIIGLRGNADQLYALARRYRVVFSVVKKPRYEVTHSAAVYVFNAKGEPEFIIAGLDTNTPDIDGISADLSDVASE
jgi:protein SCO1/2